MTTTADNITTAANALQQHDLTPPPELAAESVWQLVERASDQMRFLDRKGAMQQMLVGWSMGVRPLRALVQSGVATPATLGLLLWSVTTGQQVIDVASHQVDRSLLTKLPLDIAARMDMLPLQRDESGNIIIAIGNPTNQPALQELAKRFGKDIKLVLADPRSIHTAIEDLNQDIQLAEMTSLVSNSSQAVVETEDWTLVTDDATQVEAEATVTKLARGLIEMAATRRASDLHLDPCDKAIKVRLRIDGVLHYMQDIPPDLHRGLTQFFKNQSGIGTPDPRRPQEGGYVARFSNGKEVQLRLATVPTSYRYDGTPLEKITLRLQNMSRDLVHLGRLGMNPETLSSLTQLVSKPHGMVLVCGPTGHGKTTTLYASITHLMQSGTPLNIMTVEDPIEIHLDGVNQTAVNVKANMNFVDALRSFLRHDPDVLMVGEIRNDEETIRVAIEAALAGRLVLSSFHSSSASEVPLRMLEMGIEPFLIASAVQGVVAQRLVRVLCDRCREPNVNVEQLASIDWAGYGITPPEVIYKAHEGGCGVCRGFGYVGRRAVAEVMPMLPEIEQAVMERCTTRDIAQRAAAAGVRSLYRDAMIKVAQGETSLEEAIRVI
jgi:type IV pilus assembly protein PilB